MNVIELFVRKVKEEFIFIIVLFLLIVTTIFKVPELEYIDFKVIFILFDLMLLIYIFDKLYVLESIAIKVLNKSKNFRQLVISLIILSFFISMILTNDVALFLIIPLVLIIENKLNKTLIFPTVLITIAANLGSSVTPFGNPQNLFLFFFYKFNILDFLKITFPLGIISLLLLLIMCYFIKKKKVVIEFQNILLTNKTKIIYFSTLLVIMILSIFGIIDYKIVTIVIFISVLILERDALFKIDYFLLLTFISIFLIIGNVSSVVYVQELFRKFLIKSDYVFLFSIIVSQIISNVPTAILMSHFTNYAKELVLGVNIGGVGTLISSLASLISYKLYTKRKNKYEKKLYLKIFLYCNLIFLLILSLVFYKIKI